MKTQNVSIVSIHPDPARPLELDLQHILAALAPHSSRWKWCIRNLDWLGEKAEAVCRRVEAAGPAGVWMNSEELLNEARQVYQTIEGEFLAFPSDVDPEEISIHDEALNAFPGSQAELAIAAVDGGFFEVYAKDADVLASVRKFKDVRDEDPSRYF
jgi:hypothetical protein